MHPADIPPLSRADRIVGGLVGLLVGDALGVPYEFNDPGELPAAAEIEFDPPPRFVRSHAGTPPGTWSDDGSQALCLLASLLDRGRLDADDFGRRLIGWSRGDFWVDGRVFDVGITTQRALRILRAGMAAERAGPDGEHDNGNGSLMRVLPLALWHRGTDAELVADARRQSLVTHGHVRSQVCCAAYCLWARRTLEGSADAWGDAVSALRSVLGDDGGGDARGEFEYHVRPDDDSPGRGSGYVVDTLRSARWAVGRGPFEAAVRAAVCLGHDTDTTGAVAGGIAGLRDGLSGIPRRWREGLRGADILNPLLERLLERG
jgi:ADP-ribosylglycohydrolase